MPTAETAADLRGPYGGDIAKDLTTQICVAPVTTSSVVLDLESATYFGGAHYEDKFVRLTASGTTYYFWSNNASAVVDDAASGVTNRDRQGAVLQATIDKEECPAGRYLVVKGAAAGTIRISITNQVSR